MTLPIATASTPALPRVFLDATSHVRSHPSWSIYSIFLSSTHFASAEERSVVLLMRGSWVFSHIAAVIRGREYQEKQHGICTGISYGNFYVESEGTLVCCRNRDIALR